MLYPACENYAGVWFLVEPNGDKYGCIYATHAMQDDLDCELIVYAKNKALTFTDEDGQNGSFWAAEEFIQREYRIETGAKRDAFRRPYRAPVSRPLPRAKHVPLDLSSLDAYVTESAHEFPEYTANPDQLDEIFNALSA